MLWQARKYLLKKVTYMSLLIDLTPLKEYPNYRKVFCGQLVSIFGSQITYVALPWQLYEITQSTFAVGALAMVQLVPLLLVGFVGGAIADSFERKWICVVSEFLLALCNLVLIYLTLTNNINVLSIYILGALMASLNSLHRPAFSSLVPQLVKIEDMSRISPLNSFIGTFGMIAGPALGGFLIAQIGIKWTYLVDFGSYLFAMIMMLQLPKIPVPDSTRKVSWQSIKEGLSYAVRRKDLLGSYLVDILAMVFAFPNPLFPMLAATISGKDKLGWYYSSIAIGALLATLSSRWTINQRRHGKMITLAACGWGVFIILFGFTLPFFYLSLTCLVLAGWCDMISGIFRATIWNQTIPADKRGRLASVEMLSYASGPLIGSTFMGWLADITIPKTALILGGLLAILSCILIGRILQEFWFYLSPDTKSN
jgi:MFS family permease